MHLDVLINEYFHSSFGSSEENKSDTLKCYIWSIPNPFIRAIKEKENKMNYPEVPEVNLRPS